MKLFPITVILILGFLILPASHIFAVDPIEGDNPNPDPPPGRISLPNPLGTTTTVSELINNIIRALRDYIAPPIVGIMIIYGAFQILFAAGSEEKFKTGKKTILYAVIGYAIILIASGISSIIVDVLRRGAQQQGG